MAGSVKDADGEPGSRLGLEPGGLGGHDEVGISHIEQVLNDDWVEGDGGGTIGMAASFELGVSANASHKVDACVALDVCDPENRFEDVVGNDLRVERGHRRAVVNLLWLEGHVVPLVV